MPQLSSASCTTSLHADCQQYYYGSFRFPSARSSHLRAFLASACCKSFLLGYNSHQTNVNLSVCLAGILRLAAIPYLYFDTYDTTWEALQAFLWLAVEAHIAVICASAPALKAYFKEDPASSRYPPRPSNYSFSRYGSSASSRKFLEEKKSVPVVTDEKFLGSYFNTTGGDQGDRVWFQGSGAGVVKIYQNKKVKPRLDLDKSLPRPPSYVSFDDDVYQGRGRGFGNKVTIQGGGAF